eukprot:6817852-Karenia_brevis.AAC.1
MAIHCHLSRENLWSDKPTPSGVKTDTTKCKRFGQVDSVSHHHLLDSSSFISSSSISSCGTH